MNRLILLAVWMMLFSGCAIGLGKSLHEFSFFDAESPARYPKAKAISAETSQFVVLSFVYDTDYVDDAYAKLQAECPRGEIFNVRARYSTDLGFMAYRNKLVINALCSVN